MKIVIQLSPLQVKALAIGFAVAQGIIPKQDPALLPPEDVAVLIVGPDGKSGIAVAFDGTLDAEFDD